MAPSSSFIFVWFTLLFCINSANSKILMVGGSGRVGEAISSRLQRYKIAHRVLVRKRNDDFLLEDGSCCETVVGDVLNYASLESALKGIDIVIDVHGAKRRSR